MRSQNAQLNLKIKIKNFGHIIFASQERLT